MGVTLQVIDEHFGKSKLPIFEIDYPTEATTIGEIITRRVEEEVARVNHGKLNPEHIKAEHRMFLAGLTKQSPEVLLNPVLKKKSGNQIDVRAAVKTALNAFDSKNFFVIVNDVQYEAKDDKVTLEPNSEVIFLRLSPLQGG